MNETAFIRRALSSPGDIWQIKSLNTLAFATVPDSVFGRRRAVLAGDATYLWAKWFVEGVIDPRKIVQQNMQYPFLFAEVKRIVDESFSESIKTGPEKQELAQALARLVHNTAQAIRSRKNRTSLALRDRMLLLDLAGEPPRCWVCGAAFRTQAIDRFLGQEASKDQSLPPFVDVLKPRGLNKRDMWIEIDHVIPISQGGLETDNLRLACGWCNRHKSAHQSIYDVAGQPVAARRNPYGIFSAPQPFWTVRLLGLVGACEHPKGCTRTTRSAELTVALINGSGAANPANLRVVCDEHDPMGDSRLQIPRVVRQIWGSVDLPEECSGGAGT